jgi:hypothetical protein
MIKLSDDLRAKRDMRTNASMHVTKEEERPESHRCALPLIEPFSRRLMVWQGLLVVCIGYSMVYVPYEMAYGRCVDAPFTKALGYFSDLIFMCDLVVQMHIMLAIEQKHKDRMLIIDDRTIIAKEYLRFQFWIDLLSIGPPFGSDQYLSSQIGSYLAALSVLKLFRVIKASKILASMITVSPSVVQRFTVVFMVVVSGESGLKRGN